MGITSHPQKFIWIFFVTSIEKTKTNNRLTRPFRIVCWTLWAFYYRANCLSLTSTVIVLCILLETIGNRAFPIAVAPVCNSQSSLQLWCFMHSNIFKNLNCLPFPPQVTFEKYWCIIERCNTAPQSIDQRHFFAPFWKTVVFSVCTYLEAHKIKSDMRQSCILLWNCALVEFSD